MKFDTDTHVPQRMNPNEVDDPTIFPLARLTFVVLNEMS